MVSHGFWLVFIVFYGFFLVSMVFQGSFMVFSWFLVGVYGFNGSFIFFLDSWFFKIVSWFLIDFHCFSR